MADGNTAEYLTNLKAFRNHYNEELEKGSGFEFITKAEMVGILDNINGLFSSVGLGVRKNEIGQALPPKKGWERHG